MKFYSNKKIFWPVTLVFGLLFLVIVLGLIFGSPGQQIIRRAPTPSPFIAPTASPSGGILSVTENQLNDLNNQILDLDLKQSRLQPPTINYDISF